MKIGIDIDDVSLQFLPSLIKYYNKRFDTNLNIRDFMTYSFCDTWGGNVEEAIQIVYDFHKTDYFHNMPPVTGAVEGIMRLAQDNELHAITSRQYHIEQETRDSLDKHFPEAFTGLHLTNQYAQSGTARTKKEICEALGIELMIEDSPQYALECLAPNRDVILFNRPWNWHAELPESIPRVREWSEVTDRVC